MDERVKVSLSWSGGKDSAFALWLLMQDPGFEVALLHTTFGEETKRVGMHGIPEKLIEMQALSIGLPLDNIYYPASGDNQAYESAINRYLDFLSLEGISHIAFGDIFLEDLKKYREDQLASKDFKAVFPLWGKDTKTLSKEFIRSGFKTLICAADADKIEDQWMGKTYDEAFLNQLKDEVDPCGEFGEFHTFCYDGPIFRNPISYRLGETVMKSYDIKKEDGSTGQKRFFFIEVIE